MPPITFSRWEVRDSQNTLVAELEGGGPIDFTYAFPYLDVFTIKLTVEDSATPRNEDSETKTYIVDEYPCQGQGGGGAPPIQAIAENNQKPAGEITLVDITATDAKRCRTTIKAVKVYEADSDGKLIMITAKLSEKK